MASWLSLIDDALGTHFDAPVYDPKKGRKKLVGVIDKAAEQHKSGQTPPTRSWKTGNNNAVRFSPKLNGNPVLIQGKADLYVPAEHFQAFLADLKKDVEAGKLDAEIENALEGTGTASKPASSSGTRAARNVSTQSALNIAVAAKRRGANPPSFDAIRKLYVGQGSDPAEVDAAIEKRKKAEKA